VTQNHCGACDNTEAAVPGLGKHSGVPHGTPPPKLNAAAVEASRDPAVRQRLADLCQEIQALAAYHKARARQVMADHPGGGEAE
jgi:hypothetical protein